MTKTISIPKILQRRDCFTLIHFIISINLLVMFVITYFYWFKQDQQQSTKDDSASDRQNDALPAIDKTMSFPVHSIFFIEASCQSLTSRQACAVESAARANPDRQVNVLFVCPVTWNKFKGSAFSTLLRIKNVEAARILLDTYTEQTPLYGKFKTKLKTPDKLNVHLIDILKFITLYKYDGIYLGLDVIVARSLEDLGKNWVVKQSPAAISGDIFSFSENEGGRSLADIALNIIARDMASQKLNNLWSFDGANIMNKLVNVVCLSHNILDINTAKCLGLKVREPDRFYPISFYDRTRYFVPVDKEYFEEEKIYTYPFWDRFTKYIVYNKNSLFEQLAQKYCPDIYRFYGSSFGTV